MQMHFVLNKIVYFFKYILILLAILRVKVLK